MKALEPYVVDYSIEDILEVLTGESVADAEVNESGCYFDRDHWVSSKKIVEALRKAFEEGYSLGIRES